MTSINLSILTCGIKDYKIVRFKRQVFLCIVTSLSLSTNIYVCVYVSFILKVLTLIPYFYLYLSKSIHFSISISYCPILLPILLSLYPSRYTFLCIHLFHTIPLSTAHLFQTMYIKKRWQQALYFYFELTCKRLSCTPFSVYKSVFFSVSLYTLMQSTCPTFNEQNTSRQIFPSLKGYYYYFYITGLTMHKGFHYNESCRYLEERDTYLINGN